MKHINLLILLFIVIVSIKVIAQYEVVFSNSYPPFNYTDQKGELVGFNIDILNAINNLYDSDISINGGEWKLINQALDSGAYHAIGGTHYPGVPDDNYIYTRSTINTSHCFLYNTNHLSTFSIERLKTSNEPLVAMWESDVLIHYVQSINPSAKFLFANSYEQLIKLLDREDVTCIIGQRVGSMYYAKKLGKDYIRPLEHRILERSMGFKVSKNYPELAEILNNGLEVILANGEYQVIYDKWISDYNKDHNYWHNYIKYIMIAGILITVLLLLLLITNRVLQTKVRSKTNDLQQQLNLNAQIMMELEKQKVKAEESDKMKSAFLANMSHEIRTPMNGILGFADLLKNAELSGAEQQKYIGIIERSGSRMLNIINDIVSISKIESGQMEVHLQESNINDQIEYLYTFFKPEIEGKGMQVSYTNPLPSNEATITTDREKVYSVLTNLIKNAIKYSEKGSIEFGYQPKGKFLEFYVKDTGIGVPKNRQKAIFKRFVQADIADKMARQGAGLGLAISKAYVEMLGGKIWIESEVENPATGSKGGSTFRFTLPYQNRALKENKVKNEKQKPDEVSLKNPLKILIAEDDESSRLLISIAVKKFGSEIFYAKTGKETVEACLKNPDIDLILMDIQMPEMNGYEASREIRKFNKNIIIIAQTAFALKGDNEKALEAGCNDYISKPINSNTLIQKIKDALKKQGTSS